MAEHQVSQLLYRLSLEEPGRWFLVLGTGQETVPPYLNILNLRVYLRGFQDGLVAAGAVRDDAFFTWLRDEAGAFPGEGWDRALLERSGGDHQAAILGLFTLLHRFLLDTRPAWFVRFNQLPQRSMFQSGNGEAVTADVRLADHVRAVTGAEPASPPDVRLHAFELGDGYVHFLGLPEGVGSWWGGSGRRVAMMGTAARLAAVQGSTAPLTSLLGDPDDACVLDATREGVTVLSRGQMGAVHLRGGRLVAWTAAGTVANWTLAPGDRVLLLTEGLLARARELGPGPLPAPLATGEPLAWTQAVEAPGRRMAVAVEWVGERPAARAG